MPEQRAVAIEPGRAVWQGWLSAAQQLQRLTQGRASACEGLIASLQRRPSFAAADPWAIDAPMPAGREPASDGRAARRSTASRQVPAPRAAASAAPGRLAGPASGPRSAPSALPPGSAALRPAFAAPPTQANATIGQPAAPVDGRTAIAPEASAGRIETSPSAAASAAGSAASPAPSSIASLVAEAIARHASPAATDHPASARARSDLLPDSAAPGAQAATWPIRPAPAELRPLLQAIDLPVRAALERAAEAEATVPDTAAPLTPAADLLQRLLPSDAATPTAAQASSTSATARVAAPRAPSRLLSAPGTSTSTTTSGARLGASGHTPPEDDEEAGAEAISRLLADQAWLRGVDFT